MTSASVRTSVVSTSAGLVECADFGEGHPVLVIHGPSG